MKKKAAGKRHPLARPDVVLKQIPINLGIAAHYRATLRDLLEKMRNDLDRTLKKAYPKAAEVMALDERARKRALAMDAPDPMVVLQRLLRLWGRRWIGRFDQASGDIAAAFANRSQRNLDTMFRRRLRDAGFTVKFKPTRRMVAAFRAISAENVNLIRSVPRQYHTQVLSIVNQGVMRGGDLHQISKDLRERFHVSYERAALISRDQNAKARAVFEEARRAELNITHAQWLHSGAGAHPRPSHVKLHGKVYPIAVGAFDDDSRVRKYVWPGTEINCVPADSQIQLAYGVSKGYRRWYSGELAELVTDSGKTLRATPNHPVLTPNGWIGIGSLNEGDYVFEISEQRLPVAVLERDIDRAIPTAAQVFEALEKEGLSGAGKVPVGTWFHGEDVTDGDVDIVLAARPLTFYRQIFASEHLQDMALADTDDAGLGLRLAQQFDFASLLSAASLIGRAREALSTFGTFSLHAEPGCRAPASQLSPGAFDAGADGGSTHAVSLGERKDRLSRFMSHAQLVRVRKMGRIAFSGHVFNLETANGWYVAGGIITHNCRCTSRSILPGMPMPNQPEPPMTAPWEKAGKVNVGRAVFKSAIDPNRSRKP